MNHNNYPEWYNALMIFPVLDR